jgi:hypothetical protein
MKRLQVLQQGDMDSLCGLYSIVNAIYALFPKMKERELVKLFNHLIHHLATDRRDAIDILLDGMSLTLLRALVRVASKQQERYSRHVELSPARFSSRSVKTFISQLRTHIDDGAIAIVLLSRGGTHWTVVREITNRKLMLLDSNGAVAIRRRHCALSRKAGPIALYPASTLLLRRKKQGDLITKDTDTI